MSNFLCKIGFHNYNIIREAEYENLQMKRLGIVKYAARRVCLKCAKTQEQDVHCLGLNPPEYTYSWYNVNE